MKLLTDFHVRDILKGGTQALTLKIIASAAGFAVSIALGRIFGPEGVGIYALMLTTIMIVTTISTAGLDNAVVRFMSADLAIDNNISASKVLTTALIMVFLISSCFAFGVWLFRSFLAERILGNEVASAMLATAVLAIIFIAVSRIVAGALKALRNIPAASFVDGVILPLGILAGLYFTSGNNVERAAFSFLVGATLTGVFGGAFLIMYTRAKRIKYVPLDLITVRRLWAMAWPTLGIVLGAAVTQWTATLMLSNFSSIEEVGKFRIAWQVAFLLTFLTMATDSIISPKISALYVKAQYKDLARVLYFNVILITLFSIPAAVVLIIVSPYIFSLFGDGFEGAYSYLVILIFGLLINGTLGTAGKVLIMTGHQKISLINSTVGVLIIIVLCWLLVPSYGGEGAAVAVSITMSVRCISATILVRIFLGINILTGKVNVCKTGK